MARSYTPQDTGSFWFWNMNSSLILTRVVDFLMFHFLYQVFYRIILEFGEADPIKFCGFCCLKADPGEISSRLLFFIHPLF